MHNGIGIGGGTLVPRPPSPPAYIEKEVEHEHSDLGSDDINRYLDGDDISDYGEGPSELELDTPRVSAEKDDILDDGSGEESTPLLALPPATNELGSNLLVPQWFRPLARLCSRQTGLSRVGVIRGIKSLILALKVR